MLTGEAEAEASRRPEDNPFESKSRLHNFNFSSLSWGIQRQLRCVKSGTGSGPEIGRSDPEELVEREIRWYSSSSPKRSGEGGPSVAGAAAMPWNLRRRGKREMCVTPKVLGRKRNRNSPSPLPSPLQREKNLLQLKSSLPRPKFSRELSSEEIEDDFLMLKGAKPARRPKKKPKSLQKQLEALYPGSCLGEITADSYKIDE